MEVRCQLLGSISLPSVKEPQIPFGKVLTGMWSQSRHNNGKEKSPSPARNETQ